MKHRILLILSLCILTLSGCATENGSYIDPNGVVYNNISENAAYNMSVRDAYLISDKTFVQAMKELNGNPVGQMGVGMAYAFKQGQGPRFQQPETWVDKTLKLYPIIRDVMYLAGWGIPPGSGSGGGSIGMDRVNIGGDFYANGSIRNDKTEANGYQANVNLSRSGGSVTEDNDSYTGNAQTGGQESPATTTYDSDDSTGLTF